MLESLLLVVGDRQALFALLVLLTLAVAFVVERLLLRALRRLAARTTTTLDDLVIDALERPIFGTVVAIGVASARLALEPSPAVQEISGALLETLVVALWAVALLRISGALLRAFGGPGRPTALLQARTLPFFDILLKLAILLGASYLILVAWSVDVGAWVASAGIVGLALGFAARDSLANLFAGIFIVADAPFKLGDFIQFEDGRRGRVTHIGIRSTRVLTRDDTEINVPNAVIGNAKILNESGGPHTRERVSTTVTIAHGSDLARARAVLLAAIVDHPEIAAEPAPEVHFEAVAAAGVACTARVWVDDPALRDRMISDLNFRIYRALVAAGIEIPYAKHDVYVHEIVAAMLGGTPRGEEPPRPFDDPQRPAA